MLVSTINGRVIGEPEYQLCLKGEKFYVVDFMIEEGITLPLQVSQYLLPLPSTRIEIVGNLCTRKLYNNQRQKLDTYFRVRKVTEISEDAEVRKTINVDAVIKKIFDIYVTRQGVEYLTIAGIETDEIGHRSLIHYTLKGKEARKVRVLAKEKYMIRGTGILNRKRGGSFEVFLPKATIVNTCDEGVIKC